MNDQHSSSEQIFELSVGDVLQVGDLTVTVVEIDNGEVCFRIDSPEHENDSQLLVASSGCSPQIALPR